MKILKFYSETCGLCKVLGENLIKANIEHIAYNVDDEGNEPLLEKYTIRSLPTLVKVDDNGDVIDKRSGAATVEQLKEWCK